ncbi:MAG: hypothetical protein FWD79_07465 [Desulfobulbus sp.]|nr:hypothetical protein [Desulfobulbus sp.]
MQLRDAVTARFLPLVEMTKNHGITKEIMALPGLDAVAAEPGDGVRNRKQGANCLNAASSCPAGSAPGDRSGLSGVAALSFASFLWASKEKNGPGKGERLTCLFWDWDSLAEARSPQPIAGACSLRPPQWAIFLSARTTVPFSATRPFPIDTTKYQLSFS